MKTNTKTITLIGVLAALSVVLMFFPHFPIIPSAPFLDVDFSDVPALLASVAISPIVGVLVVLVKNVIHLLATTTGGVGELSNFLIGASFVAAAGVFSKFFLKNTLMKYKLLLVLPISAMVQIIAALFVNYFITAPAYGMIEIAKRNLYITTQCLPFNIGKDILVCIAFYFAYTLLYPKISKHMY